MVQDLIVSPLALIVAERVAGPAVVLFAECAGGGVADQPMGSRRLERARDSAHRVPPLYPFGAREAVPSAAGPAAPGEATGSTSTTA